MINNFSPVSLPWRDTLRKFDRGEFPGLVFKKQNTNNVNQSLYFREIPGEVVTLKENSNGFFFRNYQC